MFRTPLRCYLDKKANVQWFIDAIDPKFLETCGGFVYVNGNPLLTYVDVEEILGSDPIIDGMPARYCKGFAGYVYLIGKERFLVCGPTIYNMKTWGTYGETTWKILSRNPMVLDQVAFYLDLSSILDIDYRELSTVQKRAFNMFKAKYIVDDSYIRTYTVEYLINHSEDASGAIYKRGDDYIYLDSAGAMFSAERKAPYEYTIGAPLNLDRPFALPLYPVASIFKK